MQGPRACGPSTCAGQGFRLRLLGTGDRASFHRVGGPWLWLQTPSSLVSNSPLCSPPPGAAQPAPLPADPAPALSPGQMGGQSYVEGSPEGDTHADGRPGVGVEDANVGLGVAVLRLQMLRGRGSKPLPAGGLWGNRGSQAGHSLPLSPPRASYWRLPAVAPCLTSLPWAWYQRRCCGCSVRGAHRNGRQVAFPRGAKHSPATPGGILRDSEAASARQCAPTCCRSSPASPVGTLG